MKMYWNFTHPLEILDDTEWNMSLHDLPTKWSSAVNGCRQNESKQLIKNTSLETKKKETNPLLPGKHESSILNIAVLSEKVISSESGVICTDQARFTSKNSLKHRWVDFDVRGQQSTINVFTNESVIMDSYCDQKRWFDVKMP